MSLVARHLEANGMPTVIIGSAKDIVEHCGVPRFLFVDFPLGNPCGKPWDTEMQSRIAQQGLELLHQAEHPATTQTSDERWESDTWRQTFLAVTPQNRAVLAAKGEALRARRANRQSRTF